jgi:uncharacterized membrane protein
MSETPHVPPPPPPPPGGSYTPPPPPPAGGGGAPASDRGIMIFLSYFGIFALIPLLTKKEDREIQWHAKNGLAIAIAWIVVAILWNVVGYVLPATIALIWSGLGCFVGLGFLILDIMAMVKAFGGQRMRIPVISDFADKM